MGNQTNYHIQRKIGFFLKTNYHVLSTLNVFLFYFPASPFVCSFITLASLAVSHRNSNRRYHHPLYPFVPPLSPSSHQGLLPFLFQGLRTMLAAGRQGEGWNECCGCPAGVEVASRCSVWWLELSREGRSWDRRQAVVVLKL